MEPRLTAVISVSINIWRLAMDRVFLVQDSIPLCVANVESAIRIHTVRHHGNCPGSLTESSPAADDRLHYEQQQIEDCDPAWNHVGQS